MPFLSDFLSAETKGKYEVIDHFTGNKLTGTEAQAKAIAVGKFPKINLTTLTEQSAINLVKQGFPILVSKEKYDEIQAAKAPRASQPNAAPAATEKEAEKKK